MLILLLLTSHLKRLLTFALISKIEFKEFLSLATRESYHIFNGKVYKHVCGVTRSSPLGPTLLNAFPVYFEKTGSKIVQMTLSLLLLAAC